MSSVYDYRDNELETTWQVCRARKLAIVEAVVGVPLFLALAAALVILCAVM